MYDLNLKLSMTKQQCKMYIHNYATRFTKRGLPHTSNYNFPSEWAIGLKFGQSKLKHSRTLSKNFKLIPHIKRKLHSFNWMCVEDPFSQIQSHMYTRMCYLLLVVNNSCFSPFTTSSCSVLSLVSVSWSAVNSCTTIQHSHIYHNITVLPYHT